MSYLLRSISGLIWLRCRCWWLCHSLWTLRRTVLHRFCGWARNYRWV